MKITAVSRNTPTKDKGKVHVMGSNGNPICDIGQKWKDLHWQEELGGAQFVSCLSCLRIVSNLNKKNVANG